MDKKKKSIVVSFQIFFSRFSYQIRRTDLFKNGCYNINEIQKQKKPQFKTVQTSNYQFKPVYYNKHHNFSIVKISTQHISKKNIAAFVVGSTQFTHYLGIYSTRVLKYSRNLGSFPVIVIAGVSASG